MPDYKRWRLSDLKIALTDIKEKYISMGKQYDLLVVIKNQITSAIKETKDEISRLGQESAELKNDYHLISAGIDHTKMDVYNIDASIESTDFLSLRQETLSPNAEDKESMVELLLMNLDSNQISQLIIDDKLTKLKEIYQELEKLYLKVRSIYETKLFGKEIQKSLESIHSINPETEEKIRVLQSDLIKEFIEKEKSKPENKGKSLEKHLFTAADHFQLSLEAAKFGYHYKSRKVRKT